MPRIKIGKGLGDISESTLRFFKQIGVEEVHMPTRWNEKRGTRSTVRPLVPPAQTGQIPAAYENEQNSASA